MRLQEGFELIPTQKSHGRLIRRVLVNGRSIETFDQTREGIILKEFTDEMKLVAHY